MKSALDKNTQDKFKTPFKTSSFKKMEKAEKEAKEKSEKEAEKNPKKEKGFFKS